MTRIVLYRADGHLIEMVMRGFKPGPVYQLTVVSDTVMSHAVVTPTSGAAEPDKTSSYRTAMGTDLVETFPELSGSPALRVVSTMNWAAPDDTAVLIVAPPAPVRSDGQIDMSFLQDSADAVGEALARRVNPSVVPVIIIRALRAGFEELVARIEMASGLVSGEDFYPIRVPVATVSDISAALGNTTVTEAQVEVAMRVAMFFIGDSVAAAWPAS